MRPSGIAAALAATVGGLCARPAHAGWGAPPAGPAAPAPEVAAPSPPDPAPPLTPPPPAAVTRTAPSPNPVRESAPPAPNDDARAPALLQERLFASDGLSLTGSVVTRNGIRMDADSFYQLVGRPDLADARHERRVWKTVLIAGGATTMTLGAFVGFADSICFDNCQRSPLGGVMLIGGAVATLIGIVLPSDPIENKERADLVDGYNRRLRARLGLPGALETALATARLDATASPDGQAGLLVARGSF